MLGRCHRAAALKRLHLAQQRVKRVQTHGSPKEKKHTRRGKVVADVYRHTQHRWLRGRRGELLTHHTQNVINTHTHTRIQHAPPGRVACRRHAHTHTHDADEGRWTRVVARRPPPAVSSAFGSASVFFTPTPQLVRPAAFNTRRQTSVPRLPIRGAHAEAVRPSKRRHEVARELARQGLALSAWAAPRPWSNQSASLRKLRAEGYDLYSELRARRCRPGQHLRLYRQRASRNCLRRSAKRLVENGKVIVTGCLGAESDLIREKYPGVLAVTGPHQYEAVVEEVSQGPAAARTIPISICVPPQGIRLTPRHYAYLKISEGCNNRCSFCIIPHLRGRLQSRPIGDVMREAERLVDAGVKELLVISQDTSAYGLDSARTEQMARRGARGAVPEHG